MSREACPNPQPDCPWANRKGGCYSDEHHLFFPKSQYRDRIDKEFRELPENKEQICRREHDEIHATGVLPQKPSTQEMLGAIALHKSNPSC